MALTEIPIELSSTPSIVDGGNATAITIDSSENVGIGVTPTSRLHLKVAGNTYAGGIQIEDADSLTKSAITHINSSLYISAAGTNDDLIIDSSGNVGIANVPPAWGAAYASINIGSTGSLWATRTAASLTVLSDNSYHNGSASIAKNSGPGSLYTQSGGQHTWGNFASVSAGGTQTEVARMRLESAGSLNLLDGNLIVAAGHGIDFSANANAGGAAGELLDDYEYGTWTPVIPGCTISIGRANYVKIGGLVKLDFNVVITGNDSSGAAMTITGVPFTATTANSESTANPMLRYFNFDSGTTDVLMYHYSRVATIEFYEVADDSNWSVLRRDQITNNSAAIIGTLIITVD